MRVWTAATISIFGSLITRLALPLLAILVLNAGPIEVAALRSLELIAGLGVALVAGAWVDRLRRRPVLIWADLGRALLLISIPLTFALGTLTLGQIFAVGFGSAQLVAMVGAGLVAEASGLRAAAVLAPLGAVVGALVLWQSPVWGLRMETLEEQRDDALPDGIGEQPIGG